MTKHTLLDKWKWLGAVMADESLPASARQVAYHMADHVCDEREIAYPSCERLAELIGKCVRTVEGNLRVLVKAGYLKPESKFTGPGMTKRYSLVWEHRKETSGVVDKSEGEHRKVFAEHRKKPSDEHRKETSDYTTNSIPLRNPLKESEGEKDSLNGDAALTRRSGLHSVGALIGERSQGGKFSNPDKRLEWAQAKLAEKVGWEVVMAAEDANEQDHERCVRLCLQAAKTNKIGWVSPERRGAS